MSEITVPVAEDLLLTGLDLDSPAQANRSRWTGGRKVVGQPGLELWYGTAALELISTEEEERQWRAFLFALGGPANWFRWSLPCNEHDGSKPVVGSGPGNGYTLPLSGIAPSTTIAVAGQYMTVPLPSGRYRAVCLTADLTGSGGGTATAEFRPALSEIPTVGVTVETKNPFIPMSPIESRLGLSTSQGVSGTSFGVEEYR